LPAVLFGTNTRGYKRNVVLLSLYAIRGVRLSSGAETQGGPVAFGQAEPLERADVAAAEDGRIR